MADSSNDEIFDRSIDDEQTMTAAEVLTKIEELWVTEKLSPTLECHQTELVDCLIDQITQMNANLEKCAKNDFRLSIHKMELERVRYVLASYLRCRLEKIERFPTYLVQKHSEMANESTELLSHQELIFAQQYIKGIDNHFNCLALQHIPDALRELNTNKMTVKPNLNAYVFLKVKKDCPGVLIEDTSGDGADDEAVDLETGDQHLLTYKSVEPLLQAGDVVLI